MRLADLCQGWLDLPPRLRGLEVRGIASDSRRVREKDLFVALKGESADGHRFIPDAVARGAAAVLGEEKNGAYVLGVPYVRVPEARLALGRLAAAFYGQPARRLRLVGVTGTKGKTTTTWLLDHILRQAGKVTGLFGTVENRIAERRLPAPNTTPACLDLHRWLAELVRAGGTHATVEVSSHALEQERAAGVAFDGAVLTNISPEHLDYHGTFANYVAAKMKLFTGLAESAVALLPRGEAASSWIAERTAARVRWYGSDAGDGVEAFRTGPRGMSFSWHGVEVETRLWGEHNLANAIAAMTAAEALGLDRSRIARALASAVPPPGRLEEIPHSRPFRVIVDYAHTDGSLEAVLRTLRPVTQGRLIAIFGCGGDRDRAKRPRMGRVAERYADSLIITSDNPRSEPPAEILADIAQGLERPAEAVLIEDRREAIGLGIRMARDGDTVLVAGKGHETSQQFKDRVVDFDDRQVAREFLEEALAPAHAELWPQL